MTFYKLTDGTILNINKILVISKQTNDTWNILFENTEEDFYISNIDYKELAKMLGFSNTNTVIVNVRKDK